MRLEKKTVLFTLCYMNAITISNYLNFVVSKYSFSNIMAIISKYSKIVKCGINAQKFTLAPIFRRMPKITNKQIISVCSVYEVSTSISFKYVFEIINTKVKNLENI